MNALHTIPAWIAAAGLAPPTKAQYVWPASYATVPGNAVMNAPFSSPAGHPTNMTRCMVVIEPTSLPFPIGTVITQLSLRRDASHASAYTGHTGSLTVRMGRAIVAPDGVQDVRFDRLWDGQPRIVFNASANGFTVPPAPPPGALPTFQIVLPLSTSFTWQGGPLAIDFTFTPASGSPTWRLDAFAQPRGTGSFRTLGPGCPGSNGFTAFNYPLPETAVPGGLLTIQMEGSVRPPAPGTLQDLAVHVIGLSALPFAIDLGPILGMPSGCMLRNDATFLILVPLSNSSLLFGRATDRIALPASPAIAGASVFSQWLLFDNGVAAPFKATLSDAVEVIVGATGAVQPPRRARTIWKYGATGFEIDCGRMAQDEYGPVIRFN